MMLEVFDKDESLVCQINDKYDNLKHITILEIIKDFLDKDCRIDVNQS